jgi:hypothetical protein
MATPLVRTVQDQGGTMYAFASAARDLTRAHGDPDLKFEFSQYALLDLPDVTAQVNNLNTIEFEKLVDTTGNAYVNSSANDNRAWAETFENYALNLEDLIRNDDDFDPVIYKSDAEKIFFKYLEAIGALRIRAATSSEAVSSVGRYVEEDNASGTGNDYERLVKYVGTVDVINDKNYGANTYQEVFVNVPSSVGYTPVVLFEDDTYNTTSLTLTASPNIEGRSSHPESGFSIESLVDLATFPAYNINTNTTPAIGIDWNEADYYAVNVDSSINTLHDFSQKGGNFKFNVVLVYYDLYSQSNPANRATNLYGVLLLDNFTDGKIREYIKYKPNSVTGLNGNAYSLKLNIKYNTSLDNVGVENSINDFSTFSMDLFFDTTSVLENATKLLLQANDRYAGIATRLDTMENMVLSSEDANAIRSEINVLKVQVENAALNYADEASLLDMITDVNKRLNSIINGTIPTSVQYNTNVIFDGKGTKVDKSVPNKIKINNDVLGYRLLTMFDLNLSNKVVGVKITEYDPSNALNKGIYAKLKSFENMIRVPLTAASAGVANNNINIYIDDTTVTWENGQSLKLVFDDVLSLSSYNINFYTNKVNNWSLVRQVAAAELRGTKPYIELVCIDENSLTFVADILR